MKDVALGVVLKDGEVLLVMSRKHKDKWILPKGSVEKGETFEEAAIREVKEEAGAICTIRSQITTFSPKDGQQGAAFVLHLERVVPPEEWLESHERSRRWFPLAEAIEVLTHHTYMRDILKELKL